mgnify:CR=1 FL=1
MNSNTTLQRLLLLALIAVMSPAFMMAQRHEQDVRVKVRKSQDGNVMQIEEDVPAGEAEDVQGLLKKYGVEEELGEIQPGEEVEIIIRRTKDDAPVKDMNIELDRHVRPVPIEKIRHRAFLGVHYEMRNGGSHITRVMGDTPADKAGLKEGDQMFHIIQRPHRHPRIIAPTRVFPGGIAFFIPIGQRHNLGASFRAADRSKA